MKKNTILILIFFVTIIFSYSYFIEPQKLELNRYTVKSSRIKDLKIVFISDLHIRPNQKNRLEKIIELINSENPDLVLSTGDFVAGHTSRVTMQIEDIAHYLSKVKSTYGFYTTLGNHDNWYGGYKIKAYLMRNGINVLSNSNAQINVNGQNLYIAGIEDLMTANPDIYEAIQDIDTNKDPIILLTHTPDMFPKTPDYIKLTLAGHTHGGQIRIPFLGPIYTSSKYHDEYAQGWVQQIDNKTVKLPLNKEIELDKKTLFVTRGIGVSILPLRFNCPPEIVVIEFK